MNGKESVPSDPKEAFKYFQLSANQNYLEAVINLGHCYEDGSGTTRDTKQAFTLYNEAYEQAKFRPLCILVIVMKKESDVKLIKKKLPKCTTFVSKMELQLHNTEDVFFWVLESNQIPKLHSI